MGSTTTVTCQTSHDTSHVNRFTSHIIRQTSHVTRHTSHAARHTSHATRHSSHVTRHAPLAPFWLFFSAQHMHPSQSVRRRPPEYESGHRLAPASRVSPETRASCAARHQFWLPQIISAHCAVCHRRLRNPRTAPLHQQPFYSAAVDARSQNLRHFKLGI